MLEFAAPLEIIAGNPFVFVPPSALEEIFIQANRKKGPIPIRGTVNGKSYQQTLVRYRGDWRLYVNMKMLPRSPQRIGEEITVTIEFDPSDRSIEPHPEWIDALSSNEAAKEVFEQLSPSRQKEIIRYIANLKTDVSIERNVQRAIQFLLGKGSFIGRDKP